MNLDRNKILIVDDEMAIRLGLARCVKNAGFEPVVASNGSEALLLTEQHRPALVLLDVMMHGLSGLEVCRKLRENPDTRNMKIVFLSAKSQIKEQEEGLEAGGDYYVTKPFDYKELIKIIKHFLESVDE